MRTNPKILALSVIVVSTWLTTAPSAFAKNRVRSLKRATKDVGTPQHDYLNYVGKNITGWAVDGDESVDWQLYVKNSDKAHPVKIVRCKPWTFGPWQIIKAYDVKDSIDLNIGHLDNEDQFFYVTRKGDDGQFHLLDGQSGHSDGKVTMDGDMARMTWQISGGVVQIDFWAH